MMRFFVFPVGLLVGVWVLESRTYFCAAGQNNSCVGVLWVDTGLFAH